jgi:hypothetical protein
MPEYQRKSGKMECLGIAELQFTVLQDFYRANLGLLYESRQFPRDICLDRTVILKSSEVTAKVIHPSMRFNPPFWSESCRFCLELHSPFTAERIQLHPLPAQPTQGKSLTSSGALRRPFLAQLQTWKVSPAGKSMRKRKIQNKFEDPRRGHFPKLISVMDDVSGDTRPAESRRSME